MLPKRQNYTVKEVVSLKLLRFSERTLRRMIAENKIVFNRVGSGRGTIWIPASEIKRISRMT
jgi:excisionase family DNA binding protein